MKYDPNGSGLPVDWGVVDPLAAAPRYTTLVAVKQRMGVTDTAKDDELTEAIVAAEYAIDVSNGRSFPDGTGATDVSQPGPVQGIPQAVINAATQTSIAVWTEASAPTGTAGSDSWFGAIDVADIARRIVDRSVALRGFRAHPSFGVS